MKISACEMILFVAIGMLVAIPMLLLFKFKIEEYWNRPPSEPPSTPPTHYFSKALNHMRSEAQRLGINLQRAFAVSMCVLLLSMGTWGSFLAYKNVEIVDCNKGQKNIVKFPEPARQVIASVGLPCNCGD